MIKMSMVRRRTRLAYLCYRMYQRALNGRMGKISIKRHINLINALDRELSDELVPIYVNQAKDRTIYGKSAA